MRLSSPTFRSSCSRRTDSLTLSRRRIRTGATIQTASALLLHLVQACPADLASQVRKKLAKPTSSNGGMTTGGGDVEMEDDLGLGTRMLGHGEAQPGGDDEGDALVRARLSSFPSTLCARLSDSVRRSRRCRSC